MIYPEECLYYYEEENEFKDEDGNLIFNLYDYCPPWVFKLFKLNGQDYRYYNPRKKIIYILIYPEDDDAIIFTPYMEEFIEDYC